MKREEAQTADRRRRIAKLRPSSNRLSIPAVFGPGICSRAAVVWQGLTGTCRGDLEG